MADAPVIPMDGARPRRRADAGTRSVLAGADRASGERARRQRRTTPLLAGRDDVTADVPARERPSAKQAAAKKAAGTRSQATAKATTTKSAAKTAKKSAPTKQPATAKRVAAKQPAATKSAAKTTTAKATAKKPPAKTTPKKVAAKAVPGKAAAKAVPGKAAPGKAVRAKPDWVVAAEQAAAGKPAAKKAKPDWVVAAEKAAAPTKAARARPDWVVDADGAVEGKSASRAKPDWVVDAEAAAGGTADLPTGDTDATPPKPDWLRATPEVSEKLQVALAVAQQAGEMLADVVDVGRRTAAAQEQLTAALDYLSRRLTGDYEVDEFGFDPEFTDAVGFALLRPLYRRWFRVEVRGVENIPRAGGALVVANHSGTVPVDALMTMVAVHEETPDHRFLRMLGADLVFQLPFLAGLARKAGATLATNADAEKLLRDGELVGVWPEGFKGIGKPFSERYKLQRFGRGGFVSAALRTGTPIVPCSIVGAEEIYPIVADVPALARLLGLPYIPVTPFFPLLGPLGAIPLPSKWLIEFGPPLSTAEYGVTAAEDPMLVFDLTDRVRQTIQQTLYSLLVQRRSIFF